MTKIRTSDLIGAQLDWAVAKCEGIDDALCIEIVSPTGDKAMRFKSAQFSDEELYEPSIDWAQGGPIIEGERIEFQYLFTLETPEFQAFIGTERPRFFGYGPTHLIAAMRCYVASKLGDEVDIPEELL